MTISAAEVSDSLYMKSDGLCRWSQLSSSVSAGKGVRGARLCVDQPSVLDLSGALIVVTRGALHWGRIRFLCFPVRFTCAIYDLGTSWPAIVMFNLTHPYTCELGAGGSRSSHVSHSITQDEQLRQR